MNHRLNISTFGALQVLCDGQPAVGFGTDKARALLVYLAVEAGRPHSRETLAGLLWSDQSEESAMHSLRQALFSLRKVLGDDKSTLPFLLVQRETVQINPASQVDLDAARFERELRAAFRHSNHQSGLGHVDLRALQRAVDLYRGHFLDQFYLSGSPLFDEWAVIERENYARQVVQALGLLAEYHERRGETALARQAAGRLVELQPWDEHAHTLIMRMLAQDGQWSAVQAQYVACRRTLQDQLGLEPSQETEALFADLRARSARHAPLPPRFEPPAHNLPVPDTPFIGRSRELDRLSELLADPGSRLVTLVGMGGAGKTRLALEAAWGQLGLFHSGVFIIPLAGVGNLGELTGALASAAGFRFFGDRSSAEQVAAYLRSKDVLLVLDGFEHLIPTLEAENEVIAFLLGLLKAAPQLKLLVTSRNLLNLRQECLVDVAGLEFPDREKHSPAEMYSALELFEQTARRLLPGFSAVGDYGAVADICRELEGIPLAIELAASWVRLQSCSHILAAIQADIDHLSSRMRDVPAPHRSMRAVFDHSWQLLGAAEQQAFQRLAVFGGGFETPAALWVAETGLEVLESLVQQSLLHRTAAGRYTMHSLVQRFAAEKLAAIGQSAYQAAQRHALYFSAFLAERLPSLKSAGQQKALVEMEHELSNWRVAWEWLVEHDSLESLQHCSESVFHYYNIRAGFQAGMRLFQIAAARLEAHPAAEPLLGRLLTYLGALAYRAREHDTAWAALERALHILAPSDDLTGHALCLVFWSAMLARKKQHAAAQQAAEHSQQLFNQVGDVWGESYALYLQGLHLNRKGAMLEARRAIQVSLEAAQSSGDFHRQISPLNLLGDDACQAGDYDLAQRYFEQSLSISRAIGDRYNEALVALNLGTVYHLRRQVAEARGCYQASLDICRDIGDDAGQAMALSNLGELLSDTGEPDKALAYFEQGLSLSRQQQDDWSEVSCLNNLANASLELGDQPAAQRYLSQALPLVRALDAPPMAAITLLHLARLRLCQGETAQASALLSAVLSAEGLEDDIRQKAQRVIETYQVAVPLATPASVTELLAQLL